MGIDCQSCKIKNSRALLCNIVLLVNNTVLYTYKYVKRVDLMLCVFYNSEKYSMWVVLQP